MTRLTQSVFYGSWRKEGCNGIDADGDWTIGDVIRGLHLGGTNAAAPPIFGNAQQQIRSVVLVYDRNRLLVVSRANSEADRRVNA